MLKIQITPKTVGTTIDIEEGLSGTLDEYAGRAGAEVKMAVTAMIDDLAHKAADHFGNTSEEDKSAEQKRMEDPEALEAAVKAWLVKQVGSITIEDVNAFRVRVREKLKPGMPTEFGGGTMPS